MLAFAPQNADLEQRQNNGAEWRDWPAAQSDDLASPGRNKQVESE